MFIYQPNLLQLKKLVFQNTGIVYINKPEEETEDFIKELQDITSSTIISAYLFREHRMEQFTKEDWTLMFAQYACTYGYPTQSQLDMCDAMSAQTGKEIKVSNNDKVTLEPEIELTKYIVNIFESKIPLRDTQLKMIYSTPIEILVEAYGKAKFVIKESKNIVLTILFQEGGNDLVLFKTFDDILRFVVSNYGYDRDSKLPASETKLDKTILSKLDLKIPTAIRKVILGSINKLKVDDKSVAQVKKYQQFWKRIFQQLAYTSEKRMTNRFPFAFEVKERLYDKKNLHTDNSDIEYFRQHGDLGTAFSIELGNPGQMLRKLLSYIRYPMGTKYANKGNTLVRGVCKEDVKDLIEDTMFDSALSRTSPKLLLQMLQILQNKEIYDDRTEVKVYSGKHKAKYAEKAPLPGVNKEFATLVISKIKRVLSILLKERNESLGKVYLDLDKARIPVQFSGRLDTTDGMSGAYYPSGSEVDIKNIIAEKLKKDETLTINDIVVRAGLAWRGERSTDLDLNTTMVGDGKATRTLYFGHPTIKNQQGKVIGVSSGDITSCRKDTFSAELVDFMYQDTINEGYEKLVSSFNVYSGAQARELEVYFFVDVVTTKDITTQGKRITNYKLEDSVIAVRVNCKANLNVGFQFDLIKNIITVINKDIPSSQFTNICAKSKKSIDEIVGLNNIYINDIIKEFIEENQFVDDINEADTVITTNQYLIALPRLGKRVYNLAIKAEEAQELYM